MKVSEAYPAQKDADGRTWYRPKPEPGLMWGWTANPEYADPSYEVGPHAPLVLKDLGSEKTDPELIKEVFESAADLFTGERSLRSL